MIVPHPVLRAVRAPAPAPGTLRAPAPAQGTLLSPRPPGPQPRPHLGHKAGMPGGRAPESVVSAGRNPAHQVALGVTRSVGWRGWRRPFWGASARLPGSNGLAGEECKKGDWYDPWKRERQGAATGTACILYTYRLVRADSVWVRCRSSVCFPASRLPVEQRQGSPGFARTQVSQGFSSGVFVGGNRKY